jgi:hypothetical protein
MFIRFTFLVKVNIINLTKMSLLIKFTLFILINIEHSFSVQSHKASKKYIFSTVTLILVILEPTIS